MNARERRSVCVNVQCYSWNSHSRYWNERYFPRLLFVQRSVLKLSASRLMQHLTPGDVKNIDCMQGLLQAGQFLMFCNFSNNKKSIQGCRVTIVIYHLNFCYYVHARSYIHLFIGRYEVLASCEFLRRRRSVV